LHVILLASAGLLAVNPGTQEAMPWMVCSVYFMKFTTNLLTNGRNVEGYTLRADGWATAVKLLNSKAAIAIVPASMQRSSTSKSGV
jgi:hypothetical protein